MKKFLFTLTLFLAVSYQPAFAQKEIPSSAYDLYPTLEEMYGYAYGWHNGQLLIVGGKIKSDVPELTLEDFPNTELILLDFDRNRATAFSSGSLEGIIFEQMSSTGLEFYQKDQFLYLIGGYGYNETQDRFITFPYITVIDLSATIEAMLQGENPEAFFYQICDERLAIFDGILDYNGDEYFLINGRTAYKNNPFAEEPVYFEEDLNGQVRTFQMEGDAENLKISNFQTWHDLELFYDYYGPLMPDKIKQEVLKIIDFQQIK